MVTPTFCEILVSKILPTFNKECIIFNPHPQYPSWDYL